MNINKLTIILLAAFIATVAVIAACAKADGVAKVNTDPEGNAVRGFDTVSYFTGQAPLPGNAKFSIVWNGAKWLFANTENLEKFRQAPESYAPQFGGYCSYAVSHGNTADGDPQAWKIVDGKLYLNYNQKTKEAWEAEQDKLIKQGETNWLGFQVKKPEHKG